MIFPQVQCFINLCDSLILPVPEKVLPQKIDGGDSAGRKHNEPDQVVFIRKAKKFVLNQLRQDFQKVSKQATNQSRHHRNQYQFHIVIQDYLLSFRHARKNTDKLVFPTNYANYAEPPYRLFTLRTMLLFKSFVLKFTNIPSLRSDNLRYVITCL
ncbi:hypothetical protein D3C86_1397810 [compost metagenome]